MEGGLDLLTSPRSLIGCPVCEDGTCFCWIFGLRYGDQCTDQNSEGWLPWLLQFFDVLEMHFGGFAWSGGEIWISIEAAFCQRPRMKPGWVLTSLCFISLYECILLVCNLYVMVQNTIDYYFIFLGQFPLFSFKFPNIFRRWRCNFLNI